MIRTDLALERIPKGVEELSGIEKKVRSESGCIITEITIKSDEAGKPIGKSAGRYVTIETGDLARQPESFEETTELLAAEIKSLAPESGSVLVVGLGNSAITPDALGPMTVKRIIATRHLARELPKEHELSSLRSVSALAAGVLGQTGIEVAEIAKAVSSRTAPSAVVVIDALACSDSARLGTTIQLCNSGISPGSGVDNARKELSPKTLGVPVIAIGIPTVVDMHTIVETLTGEELSPDTPNMMVTTRDVDMLVTRSARLVGYAINRAFLPSFSYEDMEILCS